ncbi:MAG: hypothetical protein ABSF98_04125 [Bryobacteraceae bacterium]|jgi:hypothetical protein
MNDSPEQVQAVSEHLRAAINVLKSEEEADLSKCERHLKMALDNLTELLAPAPDAATAGRVSLATSLGLESVKVRAAHGKIAFAYQRAHRLERPSVTVLYEVLGQWPPLLKKE